MKAAFVLGLAVAANAQVDNELVSGADLVRNAGWGRSLPVGTRTPVDYNTQYLNKYGLKHDDAADEELYYNPNSNGVDKRYLPIRHPIDYNLQYLKNYGLTHDDAADEELYYNPNSNGVDKRYLPIRQPIDYNLQYLKNYGLTHDDAADDEMMVYYTKDSRGVKHYEGGYTTRDDAADDELAVLGQLIKETQPEKVEKKTHEKTRKFRHAEKN